MTATDPRTATPAWQPPQPSGRDILRFRLLVALSAAASLWYFVWLLQPHRIGNPALYGLLVLAELFNLAQAIGFWWTCARRPHPWSAAPATGHRWDVDLFIPVYDEPAVVVEPVVRAAVALRGARVRVALLDDGDRSEMRSLALRHGAAYLHRSTHRGAKAGNINDALARTSAPLVAVLDCDHVPGPRFLEATVGHFAAPGVGFVQTPQYYANAAQNGTAALAWSQQALFFGSIATGKAAHDSMFCCGTNVVFRRAALEAAGGFPETSLTEDFELSVRMHATGWRSVYVPEVLAQGLGPEDAASYVSQQLRWARGCISAIPQVLGARLPLRVRLQYLLSASYFLYGWTLVVYMLMPLLRILFGAQPLASTSAAGFLLHFAPYFVLSIACVARAGLGAYTFGAFALPAANFWVGIVSTIRAVLRRPAAFVVTPKQGYGGWQPRVVAPALVVAGLLLAVSAWGLVHNPTPGVLNGVAFALIHAVILLRGCAVALPSAHRDSGLRVPVPERAKGVVVGRAPLALPRTPPGVAPVPRPEHVREAS
ncbi:glycosyltransferase family 2 protein [Actinoplanes sp. NPDC049316]|uniref:glycosyltransferase family 2 protein n=1 Tax=Actinoplanes sp. NPDC049316 TaxID=3154727 RepID=UPI003420DDC3